MTPAERRGALIIVLLLALGTAYDLIRSGCGRRETPEVAEVRLRLRADAGAMPPVSQAAGTDSSRRLDLNRASADALEALPGIGPVLAGRIVDHRRRFGGFRNVEELLAVPGIGPALFARLSSQVEVTAVTSP